MPELVILYTGREGQPGAAVKGDPGPRGPGFSAKGAWSAGEIFGPGDAVVAEGSAAAGINSLFIQQGNVAESVSLIPPRDDSGRWVEIGAADLSNVTGAIWRVYQLHHAFTAVGTPIGYSRTANRWVAASSKIDDEVAVGVVREVVSPHEFIIQTSGEITGLDPHLLDPTGLTPFEPGRLYYVSSVRGQLTLDPANVGTNFASNAMLLTTSSTAGVILQWQQTANVVGRRPVGYADFYYDAAPGQTVFSGADLTGNTLDYAVSDQNQVYVDGLLLSAFDQYSAPGGATLTLTQPLTGGERVHIRTIIEPLEPVVPATSLPADNIAALFDGSRRSFPLTVLNGDAIPTPAAANVVVVLDGFPQEPDVDYRLVAGAATTTDIEFTTPPVAGARIWMLVGVALTTLDQLILQNLIAATAAIDQLAVVDAAMETAAVESLSADEAALAIAAVDDLRGTATDLEIDEGVF